MRRVYTEQHLLFLRNGCKWMAIGRLTEAFNLQFGLQQTEKALRAVMKVHGITGGRHKKVGYRSRSVFTAVQVAYIRDAYQRYPVSVLVGRVNKKFGLAVTTRQLRSFLSRHQIICGRTGRFDPEQTPWNAGTRGTGLCKQNSGSFSPGNVPGNVRPLGDERICSKDGFVLVKITERNPYTGAATRFKHKHVVVWEQNHGVVPHGMVVRLLDGDRTNCALDNLLLVSRAEHLRLNQLGLAGYPAELQPAVVAIARLEVKAFGLARE